MIRADGTHTGERSPRPVVGRQRRMRTWEHDRGVSGRAGLFRLIPEGVNLMDAGCVADLTREIALEGERIGRRFGLVVLDTLATCAVGMEENSAKETGIALARMSEMRHALGCSVFAVHHTGKDPGRGMRGSYRLKGDFDAVVEVSRDGMHLSTLVEKQKDGPDGTALHFTAHPVEWWRDRHGITSSLVVRPRAEGDGATGASSHHARVAEARSAIAGVLDLGVPATRATICRLLGWPRGRKYGEIDEAVGAEGAVAAHPLHGPVRLAREGDRIVMTKVGG
jgi:hypothetical protein